MPADLPKDYSQHIEHKPTMVEAREAEKHSPPFRAVEETNGKINVILAEANKQTGVKESQESTIKGVENLSQEIEDGLIINFAKNFIAKHPDKVDLIQDKENIKIWSMEGLSKVIGSRLYLVFNGDKLDGYYDKDGNIILNREDLFLSFSRQLDINDPRNKYRISNGLHKESGEFIIEGEQIIFKDKDGSKHKEGSDRFNYQVIALFIIG